MTLSERDALVLSLLERVTPLLRRYARDFRILNYDDLYQDASIHIMHLVGAGQGRFAFNRVRSRTLNTIDYLQRRQMASLDAPLESGEQGSASLIDFLPDPYQVEPLTVLLAQERLEALQSQVMAASQAQHARAVREQWDTALASAQW
jgi:hypothetical protein